MEAAPEPGTCPSGAEAEPCPELSAHRALSVAELDRELDSRSELIDDKEFDIPQVDTPPTLESILNETDDEEESFILEDPFLLNVDSADTHSYDTSSVASSDSGDRTHLKRRKKLPESLSLHGSVTRLSLLKGISAQIVSAADKVDAGLPTAIAASNLIAVGTSHGLALIFDQNQALRLCLGSTAVGAQYGAISALSINNDCSRLLCGFAKGQITMWDLASGKLLRSITDAHPPGTAILHIKFTDDPTLAICNDSGGSVFELAFKRVMGVRTCESRCLFSGSKGEVCCIEPLHAKVDLRDHPITQYSLLAMASLTKILVIGLKPSLKVWMTFPYGRMDPSSVPLLAWHFVAVQGSVNPMLAFCRGDVVHFLLNAEVSRDGNIIPDDRPPVARTGMDMRVQPGEPVMLRGTESTDDQGIVRYEWKQILGDTSVEMKSHKEDEVEVSNLQPGTYVFQLTVTDTAQQQDFTNITIMVLSSEQTEEHCLTPKKVGWCRGSFPRWFYNPSLQQCEEFIFGGCKPNKNNYLREEECKLACKNVRGSVGGRQEPVCNGNCQPPFFRCKDGCCIDAYLECDETLDCADGSDEMYCEQYAREFNRLQKINVTHKQGHCVDLPNTGQCSESIPRWYYNPFSEKCDPFTYGGCGGNDNNFQEEEECMKSCSGITKADVIGRRWELFESQSDTLSAFEVVIAVLLGICIMVVLVIIGYFFLKNRKKNSRRHQPATATNSTLSTTEDTEHLFYSSATKPV